MARNLLKYDGSVNRLTWFTTWDHALRNYYTDNMGYIPSPVKGNDHNSNIIFRSRKPCMCTVDYGDGVVEQHQFVKVRGQSYYQLMFRTLDIEYKKNPNSHPWWFYKEDNTEYVPIPNHAYADGRKDVERTVVLDFTADIYCAIFTTCVFTQFPIVEIPTLEQLDIANTRYITSIPEDRLAKSPNMKELHIGKMNTLGVTLKRISDSICNMPKLVSLKITSNYDFSDIDNSNVRSLVRLKKLRTLGIDDCSLRKYLKEFNELPELTYLDMNSSPLPLEELNAFPDMSEVDSINPALDRWGMCRGWQSGRIRTEWPEHLSGYGLGNLTSFAGDSNKNIRLDRLPSFLYEMRSCSAFYFNEDCNTQERADLFVDTFYDFVISWEYIAMSQNAKDGKRNQFYGCTISMYNSAAPTDKRPSGVEQAPAGFVLGSSNGTPQTPMEKIYVLKNNYKQKWVIAPE